MLRVVVPEFRCVKNVVRLGLSKDKNNLFNFGNVLMCVVLAIPTIPVTYILLVILAFMVPFFKVTDPNDPRFEPTKFQLIDTYFVHVQRDKYPHRKKELLSVQKLFPEGTSIEDVDTEMVDKRECIKHDENRFLKVEPYVNRPNSRMKSLKRYSCEYEWWGLFFYSFSKYDFPRLHIRVSLDENNKVIRASLR